MTVNIKRNTKSNPIMNDWMDEFFFNPIKRFEEFGLNAFKPSVNILESDHNYILEFLVPGFGKDDIDVSIDNDMLTVSGDLKVTREETDKKYSVKEFSLQSFRRSFNIPDAVKAEGIQAKHKNGLLAISLPKKDEAKPQPKRTISID